MLVYSSLCICVSCYHFAVISHTFLSTSGIWRVHLHVHSKVRSFVETLKVRDRSRGWISQSKITSLLSFSPVYALCKLNPFISTHKTSYANTHMYANPAKNDTHRSGLAWMFCGTRAKMFCSLPAVWRNGSSSRRSSESWPAPRRPAGTAGLHLPPNLQGW